MLIVLVPTFPGGSADLMKFLIEATTGIWTGNRHDKRDVIAIKTLYPYYEKHVSVEALNVEHPTAVVVMRHPLDTMEVWHAYVEHALSASATSSNDGGNSEYDFRNTPISDKKWIEWRDNHFDTEITKWEQFQRYWLNQDHIQLSHRHILVYEDLIDSKTGPQEAIDMINFIHKMTNVPKFM